MKLINPATGKPFREVKPDNNIIQLRKQILNQLGIRRLQAKYDAVQTTSQNELHWQWSDNLSPNAANSLAVRQKARSRSRYEVQNNGYLKGILLVFANDFVGSGPTLQVTDDRLSPEQQRAVEKAWKRRAKKIKLRSILWRLRYAKGQDGEGFAFSYDVRDNRTGKNVSSQRVYEADQVSNYELGWKPTQRTGEVDGIKFSTKTGEPTSYYLLNDHPGESFYSSLRPTEGKWHNAGDVIHWFRRDRAWLRGIPETLPTLPLWALLRRYTLAVVQNAEIAADFTVLLKSLQNPYGSGFPLSGTPGEPTLEDPEDWFDSFPIDTGLMTVLPSQYEAAQLKPEQPMTVYDAFVNALVQEAARCLLVPRNVALGNAGDYNMASATLDQFVYKQAIRQERFTCEEDVLDVDLEQWWYEVLRDPNYYGRESGLNGIASKNPELGREPPDHTYRWDEVPEHTDPVKVATAIDILHKGKHITDTDIQEGRFNRSVDEHYQNLEKQEEKRKEMVEEFTPELPQQETPLPGKPSTNGNGNGKPKESSKPVKANLDSRIKEEVDKALERERIRSLVRNPFDPPASRIKGFLEEEDLLEEDISVVREKYKLTDEEVTELKRRQSLKIEKNLALVSKEQQLSEMEAEELKRRYMRRVRCQKSN